MSYMNAMEFCSIQSLTLAIWREQTRDSNIADRVLQGDYGGQLPMIPGHENVGTVAVTGSAVRGFEVGDRVGVGLFQNSCDILALTLFFGNTGSVLSLTIGKCNECLEGNSNFCSKVRLAGLNSDGEMAQYTIADPSSTFKLLDSISFEDAVPMMCAGSTVLNSIRRAGQPSGSILAIVGLGGLGHLGTFYSNFA